VSKQSDYRKNVSELTCKVWLDRDLPNFEGRRQCSKHFESQDLTSARRGTVATWADLKDERSLVPRPYIRRVDLLCTLAASSTAIVVRLRCSTPRDPTEASA
jgi:hypothetical protein